MPLLGGATITPIRIEFEQRRNTQKDVYRRGDTLRKQIFVWRRVFYSTTTKPISLLATSRQGAY